MVPSHWLGFHASYRTRKSKSLAKHHRRRLGFGLEQLEERTLLTDCWSDYADAQPPHAATFTAFSADTGASNSDCITSDIALDQSDNRGSASTALAITIDTVASQTRAVPEMLADIASIIGSSNAHHFTEGDGLVYFFADDGIHGQSLFKSNGTAAGTVIVKDNILPTVGSSIEETLFVDGVLYFSIKHPQGRGGEVWRSDGIAGGTMLVHSFVSSQTLAPSELTAVGDTVYFTADDGTRGRELWKIIATRNRAAPYAAALVKDIHTTAGSNPQYLEEFGGLLYFSARTAAHNDELWRSDGTAAGTQMVLDIYPGAEGSQPKFLTSVRNRLYFAARDAAHGTELWATDGTSAGTYLVHDINPGGLGDVQQLTNVNGTLFFAANDGSGSEVWFTDGTAAGTKLVQDIGPFASHFPRELTSFNGTLFFNHASLNEGSELWKVVRTGNADDPYDAELVREIFPGRNDSMPVRLMVAGDLLFFIAHDGVSGRELWRTDGTTGGTFMVEIIPGTAGSSFWEMAPAGNRLFFTFDDGVHGREIWSSGGTVADTALLLDLHRAASSNPNKYIGLGNSVLFVANDMIHGMELWRTDGTPGGTELLKDIYPGINGSIMSDLVNLNGQIFFTAIDSTATGLELWRSDGTAAGTVLSSDIDTGSPFGFVVANNTLYFSATQSGTGRELWRSGGLDGDATRVTDIAVGDADATPDRLIEAAGTLFFTATDGIAHGRELWRINPSTGNAELVRDIWPGGEWGFPRELVDVNGTLFFTANDGTNGNELWKYVGLTDGAVMVKDIRTGAAGSFPRNLVNLNGTLFFIANDGINGEELWKNDGTSLGTQLVKAIVPGTGKAIDHLTVAGDIVYFAADDGVHGMELWRSDGTAEGTRLVRDIRPGSTNSMISQLIDVNGLLYFVADDGERGLELWRSDGTEQGTALVHDIHPGLGNSNADQLAVIGGDLYFTATDGLHGREAWRLRVQNINDPPSDVTLSSSTVNEDAAGAVIGELIVTDSDAGDSHTFTVADDRFEIADAQLRLKSSQAVDFESHSQVMVTVTVTDQAGATLEKALAIQVTDINEQPSLTVVGEAIDENVLGAVVGDVTFTDPDNGQSHSLSVSDQRFEIVGGKLKLKGDRSLNYETETEVDVIVIATDSGTPALSAITTLTVAVNNVNDSPVLTVPQEPRVDENAAGVALGAVTVTDEDAGQTVGLLVSDDRFEIVAGSLKLKDDVSLDHEAAATVSVELTAQDSGVPMRTVTMTVTVAVSNINEAPSITLANATVAENQSGQVVGVVVLDDPDQGQTHTFTLTDDRFEVVAGQLKLKEGMALDYEAGASVSFDVAARDSGSPLLSDRHTWTVTVLDVDEAPTGIKLSASSLSENAPGAVVGRISVVDSDSGDVHDVTVSDSRFEIVAGDLRLKAGESLDFETTPALDITLTAADRDDAALRVTVPVTISLTDVNEPPVVVAPVADQVVREYQPLEVQLDPHAFEDPEGGPIVVLNIQLSDGSELPPWLVYDSVTHKLFLSPKRADLGTVSLVVSALDESNLAGSDEFEIAVLASPTPYRNPIDQMDVSAGGGISALDVLLVINFINRFGAQPLQTPVVEDFEPPPFLDVSGDNFVSPVDALLVINLLNSRVGGAEGEASHESSSSNRVARHATDDSFEAPLEHLVQVPLSSRPPRNVPFDAEPPRPRPRTWLSEVHTRVVTITKSDREDPRRAEHVDRLLSEDDVWSELDSVWESELEKLSRLLNSPAA